VGGTNLGSKPKHLGDPGLGFPPLQRTQEWGTLIRGGFQQSKKVGHPQLQVCAWGLLLASVWQNNTSKSEPQSGERIKPRRKPWVKVGTRKSTEGAKEMSSRTHFNRRRKSRQMSWGSSR